jgi:general L-amino acid transport system substrate-binding protein
MQARTFLLVCACLLVAGWSERAAASTLESVRDRGTLICAVISEDADYTKDDAHGPLTDFAAGLCKAVAAAALGDADKARFLTLPDEQHGLKALKSGKAELMPIATPDPRMGAIHNVAFGPPVFFDGQSFLVGRDQGVAKLADLAGKQVCYIGSTEADTMLTAAVEKQNVKILPFPFEELGEMEAALVSGHCAAMTADISLLANARAAFHGRIGSYTILPEAITFDPLAPAYARGDAQWAAIVDWTVYALIQAEASGVTRANLEEMRKSDDPLLQRLLSNSSGLARGLGLEADWAVRAIKAVGNYGELFETTLGKASPLDLPRGRNALWTEGGLMHPAPLR